MEAIEVASNRLGSGRETWVTSKKLNVFHWLQLAKEIYSACVSDRRQSHCYKVLQEGIAMDAWVMHLLRASQNLWYSGVAIRLRT